MILIWIHRGRRRKIGSVVDAGLNYYPYESCEKPCAYISQPKFLLYFSSTLWLLFSASSVDARINSGLLGVTSMHDSSFLIISKGFFYI